MEKILTIIIPIYIMSYYLHYYFRFSDCSEHGEGGRAKVKIK